MSDLKRKRTQGPLGDALWELLGRRGVDIENFEQITNQDEGEVDETQRFVAILEQRDSCGGLVDGVLTCSDVESLIWWFLEEKKWEGGFPLYTLQEVHDLETGQRLKVDIKVEIGKTVVERHL